MSLSQAAYALDPSLWAEKLGFHPDPWQAEVLRSTASRTMLCCSRQSGKSSICALLALWTAIYQPGSLILCLSPSLRQSSELFHTVARFYGALSEPVAAEGESALRVELANGSRIISLPGQEQTVRGYAGVSLLIVDEAARVPDDLYYSIRPMLAVSNGRLIALSTPWGRRGWFFHEWTEGEGWQKVSITADQCPRISPEFLAEERRSMPEAWFNAEYNCVFAEAEGSLFRYEEVMNMLDDTIVPWDDEVEGSGS